MIVLEWGRQMANPCSREQCILQVKDTLVVKEHVNATIRQFLQMFMMLLHQIRWMLGLCWLHVIFFQSGSHFSCLGIFWFGMKLTHCFMSYNWLFVSAAVDSSFIGVNNSSTYVYYGMSYLIKMSNLCIGARFTKIIYQWVHIYTCMSMGYKYSLSVMF